MYHRLVNAFLYALICLIWGSTWLAIKVGLNGVPPFLGAGLRFVIAAAIIGVALAVRRQRIRLSRNDRICILSLGLLVFWLDYAGVYWAELHISSGLTAILFSTMPLMTALLSRYWARSETVGRGKIAGILVGVAGTVMLFWPGERLGLQQALGMLAALGASFCAAVNLVMIKRYGADGDPFVLNFLGMSLGAACLMCMSGLLERWSAVAWSRNNVLALLYLAVIGSVVAFSAYYRLIKVMDATVVSLSTLVIPIVALVLGRLFLGEVIASTAVAGVATILAGVGIASLPSASRIGPGKTVDAIPADRSKRKPQSA